MSTSNEERASQSTSEIIQQTTGETPSSADMHSCGASPQNPTQASNNNKSTLSSCDKSIDPVSFGTNTYNNQHSSKNAKGTTPATPATKTSLAHRQQPTTPNQSLCDNRSSQQQQQPKHIAHQQDSTYHLNLRQQQQQINQQHLATEHLAPHQWSVSSNGPAAAVAGAPGTGANTTQRCLYPAASGVDKLIWAAMMEDAATMAAISNAHKYNQHHQQQNNAAATANHYLPLGRGIGYLNNARDSQIPTPSNKSELELYRLLERANLLNYFATFLSYGGDDVQQLSDAEEDEFLEIMSLVGMTEKPLHVRRMQKALIEWRESKEAENNFRRPSQYQYFSGSHYGNYNGYMDSSYHKPQHHNQQQHINNLNSGIFADSPAPTPTSPSSIAVLASDDQQSNISMDIGSTRPNHNQVHSTPHDILVGAPKRPRLMDSLHRTDNSSRRSTSKSPPPL